MFDVPAEDVLVRSFEHDLFYAERLNKCRNLLELFDDAFDQSIRDERNCFK